jgi:hypothetical protein
MLVANGKYYLYRHIRLDKEAPFYVGIGSKNGLHFASESNEYARAFATKKRNIFWQKIIAKTQYNVEIVLESNNYSFIQEKEKEFIQLHKDTLCNMTLGGEGTLGLSPWNKGINMWTGDRVHPNKGKPLSEKTKLKKSNSMKLSEKSWKGKKLPKETVDKMRQSKLGTKNPMYGKHTPVSKKVINVETKEVFNTILLAGASIGLKGRLLHQYLSGHRVNKSPFIYLDTYNTIGEKESCKKINQSAKVNKGNSKKVFDVSNGKEYLNAKIAAIALGFNETYLRCMLAGSKKNKTNLRYKNEL